MNEFLLPLVLGVPFAAWVGLYISRKSITQQPILGGKAARAAHYLGAAGASGGAIYLPFVPILFILGRDVGWALVLGLTSLLCGLGALVVFAVIERPALAAVKPPEDGGWTEADARKSGL